MITAPAAYADRLLTDIREQLGRPVPAALVRALRAVPRHAFLPDRIWLRDGVGGYEPCDRAADPDGWMAAAYSDAPLVTQFTDGLPSSSASMPSTVLRILELADLQAPAGSPAVLELGTGTGFNAALLCALLVDEAVTTVELDPDLAERAERALKALGCAPTVIQGDAAGGWPGGAPYDRIVATFSVDHVPAAWMAQVRPGGRIVTPWSTGWCTYGTLTLDLEPDGTAVGRWHDFASYMPMRCAAPPSGSLSTAAAVAGAPGAASSRTRLSPWAVAGGDLAAEFHIGLAVPGVSFAWDTSGEHAHTRLELQDAASGSWATVDYDGHAGDEFAAAQDGPRRLWDEVTTAYDRWEQLGRPGVERHGLTVRPGGATTLWLDSPERPL